jgi:hypothetical protein
MAIENRRVELRPDLELNRIVSLAEAAALRGVSKDTIKRRYPEIIIKLSPRRVGVRLRDALNLGAETAA